MKLSSTWFALILIASALLLSAAPKGSAQEQSPRPGIHRKTPLTEKGKNSTTAKQANTVSPSPTPETQPTEPRIHSPEARNTASKIQEGGDAKERVISQSVTDGSSGLQMFFTLVTTVATCFLAWFTFQLVAVTRDLHTATKKGTEVAEENVKAARASAEAARAQLEFTKTANEQNIQITTQATEAAKQSARATELALYAERPYVFVEGQQIAISLRLSGFANMLKYPVPIDVSADPLAHKGMDEADAADLQLEFDLRNRGKGVAVIRNVHIRMLIGRGFGEPYAPLWTAGRCDGHIRYGVKVLGLGDTAHVSSGGLRLSLDMLGTIKVLEASLRFVVLVSYEDVYKRRYSTTFPFEYRAPVTRFGGQELLSGPLLLPAFKVHRKRYG